MKKVLMVCLGNICRSPLAEGILQKKADEKGFQIEVDSAGTSGYHIGEQPDSRMRETAKNKGVSIDHLRARQFEVEDFDRFDLIYAMDKSNLKNILQLARNEEDKKKVRLIIEESHPGMGLEVPDPYFGGQQGFVTVYNLLDEASDAILKKIQNGER